MQQYQVNSAPLGYFNRKQSLAVDTGPGKGYHRANKGKASVSTNGEVWCFGTDAGGEYYLILYELNNGKHRIGYVRRDDISGGYDLTQTPIPRCDVQVKFVQDAVLTDDPGASNAKLCTIRNGARATLLFFRGEYACVDLEKSDVGKVRGFVPYYAIEIAE